MSALDFLISIVGFAIGFLLTHWLVVPAMFWWLDRREWRRRREDMHVMNRWYCPRCGIVRDTPGGVAPWCRHNALDLPASRMAPIKGSHPYATGPLPWGDSDPSRSAA